MDIRIFARSKREKNTEYRLADRFGLEAEINRLSGSGSAGNPVELLIKIRNTASEIWEGVIRIEYYFPKKEPRFFLPAFLYGRNKGENAANTKWQYPRLREGEVRLPYSPWWMVRSDRLSHPVAFVHEEEPAYDTGKVYGLSGSPYFLEKNQRKEPWRPGKEGTFYQYGGFGCSLEKGALYYTLGYENAPVMFVNSDTVKERKKLGENCFLLLPGEEVEIPLWLYEYEGADAVSITEALEDVYERFHELPREKSSVEETVRDISQSIYEDAFRQKGQNYATQVYQNPEGGFSYNEWFSISWTGGLETAVPLLMAGLRLSHEKMRLQALSCIQNIVDHSLNARSGLPYDACNEGKWSVDGWWREHTHSRGHASYLVGQAIYYLLKAWEYEKSLKGIWHEDWLAFAKNVIAKMESDKNADGEYPYLWSEKTGAGIEYDSFAGAWCLACAAYYSVLLDDFSMISEIKRSEAHYYEAFLKRMECYGTPLDTDKAVDSEGILAYIKGVRYLHQLSGEEIYLKHLQEALGYEYSFKFCYNSPIKVPPLSRLGWSSSGGSVTSTCNPHIHPMSENVVDEMLYYLSLRKDSYVEMRLKDTVLWGCQTYNTFAGEYDFGKKGWMSERFCHSEALLVEKYPDGSPASTWFALLPWGGANIVEGLTGAFWEHRQK